ncbi:hypothetical protein D104_03470 [Marinomonas profundimaris]|uniref:Uncharacterized protein n=1 Tax=Marinomonas profundimaris TaxID=1208321 RepID=W1RYF2_9GAMM|nr:hypothetical protein D104_03470 [Marinomonas profundimaris]
MLVVDYTLLVLLTLIFDRDIVLFQDIILLIFKTRHFLLQKYKNILFIVKVFILTLTNVGCIK